MPKAPASIDVLVYPTDGRLEYIDNLETVKVDNLERSSSATLNAPYDLLQSLEEELLADLESAKMWKAGDAMVYRGDKHQLEPKITLQPDTGTYWSRSSIAWKDRAVLGNIQYHAFFTISSDPALDINSRVSPDLRGEVFVLKLSDTVDENGLRFYVDFPQVTSQSECVIVDRCIEQVRRFVENRPHAMHRLRWASDMAALSGMR